MENFKMTTRTVRFYGRGYGNTPVEITVTANGSTVYNGPVPTAPVNSSTNSQRLFDMQLPIGFSGVIPMSILVNSGEYIQLNDVEANYPYLPSSVYTPEQRAIVTNPDSSPAALQAGLDIITSVANPPLSPEEISQIKDPDIDPQLEQSILLAHNANIWYSGGPTFFGTLIDPGKNCMSNLFINESPLDPSTTQFTVPVGSVLRFDLTISYGLE
jgi:hypothetical protein